MLRFGYFDSDIIGIDDEGMPIFDRAESSDLFALLFANLVSDGVLALPPTCFRVRAAGSGLNLELDPGFGMVKGHFCYNDEVDQLAIEAAPQQYSRIDRVVMRCNYLEKMVEIVIKTGTEATNPVPPELIRPSAGDYFELCLANVRLTAGQTVITQSSITDTRADSSVCGYITQLVDHLDTATFFSQLDAFYQEFVSKSNASYESFLAMAQRAYDNLTGTMEQFYAELSQQGQTLHAQYSGELAEYLAQLESKGDSDLAALTQQLIEFRNANEAKFLEWFETVKGVFSTDAAGELLLQIEGLNGQVAELEEMLFTGMVRAELVTSNGDSIIDSVGNTIVVGHPICRC